MNAIDVQNISKFYRLYGKPSDRLREVFSRRRLHQTFEALRDVTFPIEVGESVGIIGENGAGKSTLLKILAGTVTPSTGQLSIIGRVAALLELGSAFHPEFSGRQNVYLNAALLGLNQAQIHENEKDILSFAELGNFIDQPIKTYSSGMIMRLAFSIATSVDPDILIIDEALSVGDAYFQQKCIDRMLSFREKGRTVLFCSHSTYSVNLLCDRAIWLYRGRIRADGPATKVCALFSNFLSEKSDSVQAEEKAAENKPSEATPVLIKSIILNGESGPITLKHKDSLDIVLEFESMADPAFCVSMGIRRSGEKYWHAVNMTHDGLKPFSGKGAGRIMLTYPSLPLLQGEYTITGFILDESGLLCHHKKESSPFTVVPPDQWENEMGVLALEHVWKVF